MKICLGVFIGVWCLCGATAVHADYRSEFREGVKALNFRNWNEAIRRFRLAIQENPKETGERLDITSGDFEPYLPHALLGLALYQSTGRCDQALPEFQISRAQKAPWSRSRRETALVRAEAACPPPAPPTGPDPALFKAALQRADKAIADAGEFQREVATLGKDPALQPQWSANARLGPALSAADAQLAGARRSLDEARKTSDPKDAAAAQQSAESARDRFAAIRTAAKELATPPAPPPPVVPVDNTTKPAPGTEPPVDLGRGTVTPRPTTSKPQAAVPPTLANAAGQFFRAQYSNAATSLSAEKFDRVEDALQAEWFKAASYYSLYLLSGKTDEASRTRAEEHVRTCRRLQPSFLPDRGFFSPALIAFYQSVR